MNIQFALVKSNFIDNCALSLMILFLDWLSLGCNGYMHKGGQPCSASLAILLIAILVVFAAFLSNPEGVVIK